MVLNDTENDLTFEVEKRVAEKDTNSTRIIYFSNNFGFNSKKDGKFDGIPQNFASDYY